MHCCAGRVDKVVNIRLQEVKRCKSSSNCCFKMRCNDWMLQFLYVKSYPRVLVFPILLQLQIYCHPYKNVVITSYIGAGKSSCFRLVDARLESPRCQDVVDLVVCFSIRGMPCSPGSLLWVWCVCNGKVFTACKF